MKKVILSVLGIYLVISAVFSGGVFDSLVSLLIAGAIPGTTYSIPADAMLLFWGVSAWLMLVRLVIIPMIKFGYTAHKPLIDQVKPNRPQESTNRHSTPRRRYSTIQKKPKSLRSAK